MTDSDKPFDVAVIGAGVAGAAVARELSRYRVSVALVDKEADVCFGATKGSHAFIHCGLPSPQSPLKNRGELAGNRMMPQICRDLDVPFKPVGKLLVAFDDTETAALKDLEQNLADRGVAGVRLIRGREALTRMEPHLSHRVVAALHTPTTGITTPWGLVFGLVENAVANGCRLILNTPVTGIETLPDGTMALSAGRRRIVARYVVNAAGPWAGQVARMVGDHSLVMELLKMQRVIMDRRCGGLVTHLIRGLDQGAPVGDFVAPTVDGNLMVGSTVEWLEQGDDGATTRDGIHDWVIPAGRRLVPDLAADQIIRPFSGTMPKAGDDYQIRPSAAAPQLIHFVLGASGLTASVAMAEYLAREILPGLGLALEEKTDFMPNRRDMDHFHDLTHTQRAGRIAQDPRFGRMVCRCEGVSEGEIAAAIGRGAVTRDGIKFRTRAGMGRCQGNFCGHKLLEIMSREIGRPVDTLTRRGRDSFELLPPDRVPRKHGGEN